ncbi:hypothetical protein Cflav_PD6312 [Pedosphaera parvula Ellin514]|uniref:Uncharacterized protein n=1 Tax=Pedosphaera parvula (strain Ellin514) TaxID=320771 RepID=B9XD91_PEDPL|nr:hypothetical protein Cflav_PD6312 [Pedosphaera parvula Ellin514]
MRKFISHCEQGAFDLRRRCRPGRYLRIAPAASALPQIKIPPAIRKFLSAFGIVNEVSALVSHAYNLLQVRWFFGFANHEVGHVRS